jgi:hypothetical protein
MKTAGRGCAVDDGGADVSPEMKRVGVLHGESVRVSGLKAFGVQE